VRTRYDSDTRSKVTHFEGNLTKTLELRVTTTGKPVATIGLAVEQSLRNFDTRKWEVKTTFHGVVCWGPLAENVAESLSSGDRVVVIGRLQESTWQTAQGQRSNVEIVAGDVASSLKWATAVVTKVKRGDAA
jgi:single-strand DNA-binding protein